MASSQKKPWTVYDRPWLDVPVLHRLQPPPPPVSNHYAGFFFHDVFFLAQGKYPVNNKFLSFPIPAFFPETLSMLTPPLFSYYNKGNAWVAEQADARDLKSLAPRECTGSIPVPGINDILYLQPTC